MDTGSPKGLDQAMEEEEVSTCSSRGEQEQQTSQCSPPLPPEELLQQIRRLQESHTMLEQEMKKLLEERERVVQALKRQEESASSSIESPASHMKRSLSMSPPPAKHGESRLPRRTLSEKLSEKDLSGAISTLSVSEHPYVDILQSMGQAVYMFTTSAEVTYWNRMAERLYGWSASEAIGRNIMELLVDSSSQETASKIVARLCVGESWVGQFPLKKKSGEIFPAMITNTPFYDSEGKLVGVVGVSSDARPFMKPVSAEGNTQDTRVWKPPSNWQQPWQIPFASTLSNLASKILSHLRGNIMEASRGFGLRSGSWTGRLWPWGCAEQGVKQSGLATLQNLEQSDSQLLGFENNVHSSMSSTASMTSTASSSSSSRLGHSLDELESPEYEITWDALTLHDQIGQGSCATVYRGTWCGLDVAVKVFHDMQYNEVGIEDFRKEVAIMKKLRHPNVVLFLGAATSSERLYIVTELMPRGSLFKILHRRPSGLDWKRKLNMALDVAKGMTYLHNCTPAIVHRDLKSTNLLVDRNLRVKVCDFSLSRLKHSNFLTGNARMGTSQWMPPEVLRSEASNEKSDVYSFGVILWELATEEVPWKDLDPLQVIAVVGFMDKRLTIPETVDPKFAAIIRDCWKGDWVLRPSFEELTGRLKELIREPQ